MMTHGILCGSDSLQEWLLPWWWSRYKEHNDFPVTFCDFGMSQEAREWCKERGSVVDIVVDSTRLTPSEQIAPVRAAAWEALYGKSLWQARQAWFKKPVALLATPYEETIWIDTDCEILAPIAPLFGMCTSNLPFALVREPISDHLPPFHPDIKYNSGVIAYRRKTPLVIRWAEESQVSNHLFWGDDPLLSHLISSEKFCISEIPQEWNWRICYGFSLHAKIFHWVGSGGKNFIRERGGVKPSLDRFYAACGRMR